MGTKRLWTIAILSAAALLVAGCGGDSAPEAFCDAARSVAENGGTDPAGIQADLDTMVDEAPDEIKDAATAVRDAFQAVTEGNFEALTAAEADFTEFTDYLDENCDVEE